MKLSRSLSIIDLIGVLLVVVALVSAGGMVYIASEYSNISDAYVSTNAFISGLRFTRNNESGELFISIMVTLDNPSNLDVEVYRIECNTNVDRTTSTVTAYDRYVGAGSTGEGNGTVHAGSMKEFSVSQIILPETVYTDRIDYALDGGNELWTFVRGFIWFRIADYPDVWNRLPIGIMRQVEVHNV